MWNSYYVRNVPIMRSAHTQTDAAAFECTSHTTCEQSSSQQNDLISDKNKESKKYCLKPLFPQSRISDIERSDISKSNTERKCESSVSRNPSLPQDRNILTNFNAGVEISENNQNIRISLDVSQSSIENIVSAFQKAVTPTLLQNPRKESSHEICSTEHDRNQIEVVKSSTDIENHNEREIEKSKQKIPEPVAESNNSYVLSAAIDGDEHLEENLENCFQNESSLADTSNLHFIPEAIDVSSNIIESGDTETNLPKKRKSIISLILNYESMAHSHAQVQSTIDCEIPAESLSLNKSESMGLSNDKPEKAVSRASNDFQGAESTKAKSDSKLCNNIQHVNGNVSHVKPIKLVNDFHDQCEQSFVLEKQRAEVSTDFSSNRTMSKGVAPEVPNKHCDENSEIDISYAEQKSDSCSETDLAEETESSKIFESEVSEETKNVLHISPKLSQEKCDNVDFSNANSNDNQVTKDHENSVGLTSCSQNNSDQKSNEVNKEQNYKNDSLVPKHNKNTLSQHSIEINKNKQDSSEEEKMVDDTVNEMKSVCSEVVSLVQYLNSDGIQNVTDEMENSSTLDEINANIEQNHEVETPILTFDFKDSGTVIEETTFEVGEDQIKSASSFSNASNCIMAHEDAEEEPLSNGSTQITDLDIRKCRDKEKLDQDKKQLFEKDQRNVLISKSLVPSENTNRHIEKSIDISECSHYIYSENDLVACKTGKIIFEQNTLQLTNHLEIVSEDEKTENDSKPEIKSSKLELSQVIERYEHPSSRTEVHNKSVENNQNHLISTDFKPGERKKSEILVTKNSLCIQSDSTEKRIFLEVADSVQNNNVENCDIDSQSMFSTENEINNKNQKAPLCSSSDEILEKEVLGESMDHDNSKLSEIRKVSNEAQINRRDSAIETSRKEYLQSILESGTASIESDLSSLNSSEMSNSLTVFPDSHIEGEKLVSKTFASEVLESSNKPVQTSTPVALTKVTSPELQDCKSIVTSASMRIPSVESRETISSGESSLIPNQEALLQPNISFNTESLKDDPETRKCLPQPVKISTVCDVGSSCVDIINSNEELKKIKDATLIKQHTDNTMGFDHNLEIRESLRAKSNEEVQKMNKQELLGTSLKILNENTLSSVEASIDEKENNRVKNVKTPLKNSNEKLLALDAEFEKQEEIQIVQLVGTRLNILNENTFDSDEEPIAEQDHQSFELVSTSVQVLNRNSPDTVSHFVEEQKKIQSVQFVGTSLEISTENVLDSDEQSIPELKEIGKEQTTFDKQFSSNNADIYAKSIENADETEFKIVSDIELDSSRINSALVINKILNELEETEGISNQGSNFSEANVTLDNVSSIPNMKLLCDSSVESHTEIVEIKSQSPVSETSNVKKSCEKSISKAGAIKNCPKSSPQSMEDAMKISSNFVNEEITGSVLIISEDSLNKNAESNFEKRGNSELSKSNDILENNSQQIASEKPMLDKKCDAQNENVEEIIISFEDTAHKEVTHFSNTKDSKQNSISCPQEPEKESTNSSQKASYAFVKCLLTKKTATISLPKKPDHKTTSENTPKELNAIDNSNTELSFGSLECDKNADLTQPEVSKTMLPTSENYHKIEPVKNLLMVQTVLDKSDNGENSNQEIASSNETIIENDLNITYVSSTQNKEELLLKSKEESDELENASNCEIESENSISTQDEVDAAPTRKRFTSEIILPDTSVEEKKHADNCASLCGEKVGSETTNSLHTLKRNNRCKSEEPVARSSKTNAKQIQLRRSSETVVKRYSNESSTDAGSTSRRASPRIANKKNKSLDSGLEAEKPLRKTRSIQDDTVPFKVTRTRAKGVVDSSESDQSEKVSTPVKKRAGARSTVLSEKMRSSNSLEKVSEESNTPRKRGRVNITETLQEDTIPAKVPKAKGTVDSSESDQSELNAETASTPVKIRSSTRKAALSSKIKSVNSLEKVSEELPTPRKKARDNATALAATQDSLTQSESSLSATSSRSRSRNTNLKSTVANSTKKTSRAGKE